MNKFKCQKCRKELFGGEFVLTNHSEPWTESHTNVCSAKQFVWYLKDEVLETWLQSQIDAGGWIKGKLHCPFCSLRIGSYDFVSGKQCDCGSHVLPPIHIVKSKVDHENPQLLREALEAQIVVPPAATDFSDFTVVAPGNAGP
ncbi:E3 ubiquitin-protein ligase RNF180 [Galendromus occidentalis]|uniref:E3 ubiquitin-protein ligase RNF180 n=1 Tax=Galendromus occidentalis TaxID=34638 RepID=A0AAJ7PAH7_9ACAR|nr:E3 ubiquitin-protein ligase RNF180 [Galendromus occidentalis]